METKSQILASEHQQSYFNRTQGKSSHFLDEAKSYLESTFDKDPGDMERKHRLKQQFRERRTLSKPKDKNFPRSMKALPAVR